MVLYIVGIAIIVGLAALLWRKYRGSEDWRRETSFFIDLVAMGTTALIVGVLAFVQLQSAPSSQQADPEPVAVQPTAVETIPLPEEEAPLPEIEAPEGNEQEQEEEPARETPTVTSTVRERVTATIELTATVEDSGTLTSTLPVTSTVEATGAVEATGTAESTSTPEATETPVPTQGGTQVYIVKEGDRLGAIALAYGVTTEQIVAANPGMNPDALQIGQQITIPSASTPAATPVPAATSAPSSGTRTYTVQEGDYLNRIAARLGVSAADIIALNPGIDAENLRIGQVLRVP